MTTPPPVGVPGKWKAKWVEEWNHGLGPKFSSGVPWEPWIGKASCSPESSSEIACYAEACCKVKDSILTLQAVDVQTDIGGVVYDYATGWVSSCLSGLTVGDGECFEARVMLPEAPGGVIANWCGVWLTQLNNEPANGEDDVIESWDGEATCTFHSAYGKPTNAIPGGWAGRWITVGSLRSTDGNRYVYYDGKQVAEQSMGGVTDDLFVVLSMTLDPSVNPAPVLVPAAMKIDYVRCWTPA